MTNINLTPLEQAQEVLRQFRAVVDGVLPSYRRDADAKHCALLHVNGIIENNPTNLSGVSTIEYWQDVKAVLYNL